MASYFPARPGIVIKLDTEVAYEMKERLGCVTDLGRVTHILWHSADEHKKTLKQQLHHMVKESIVVSQQQVRQEFHTSYLQKQLRLPSAFAGSEGGSFLTG